LVQRFLVHKANFERNVLATLLPAIAGAVNASGFFAVGTYTSHMTGIVSRAGDELAERHWWLATRAFFFLGCFIFGAMLATALVLHARKRQQPAFWRPLLLEAALLLCFASVNVGAGHRAHINSFTMTSLICIAMGVQNALVTKLSGARIRTTHLTGVSTDIGIELMKMLDRWRQISSGSTAAERLRLLALVSRDAEAKHLRLHLRILGCFLIGATLGPAFYLLVGHWSMLIPVGLICGLAAFDVRLGLGSNAAPEPPMAVPPLARQG
jgi:uncharacterized membrane protein YoaK (UPF0700 family)